MAREGVELDVSETELKLGLPGTEKKRVFCVVDGNENGGKKSNKNEVVGWPPVCSYRRRNVEAKTNVKVSMDGAPFLRKIELGTHTSYSDLGNALDKLFGSSCIIGEAMKDARGSSELIPIYEDKDGDWMLVGDVPWQMFRETCKRLRIMRKSEAEGFGVNLKGASKE